MTVLAQVHDTGAAAGEAEGDGAADHAAADDQDLGIKRAGHRLAGGRLFFAYGHAFKCPGLPCIVQSRFFIKRIKIKQFIFFG